MSEPRQEGSPQRSRARGVLLLVAAVAVIVVPAFLGYLLLRGDGAPSAESATGGGEMAGDDMSGAEAMSSESPDVRPAGVGDFAEIQATEIVIEPDPSGTEAVLRVTTSIDVACAVAYGPTADLGLLATDTDMAGGGHSEHHPLMRGLSPDTTYWYRIQAIAADGALYQSELMQFTSAAGSGATPAVQPPAPNVAQSARVIDVSSEYSGAYAGGNAIDGDLSTEWSSAGDGDEAYIVLEFEDDMAVSGVGFRTREMTDGTSITTAFTVTVDGETTYGPFDAGPGLAIARVDFTGRTLRFDVDTSTGGNTGAIEVEVYGEPEM